MNHKEYADSLRMIADFWERNPHLKLPHNAETYDYFSANKREQFAEFVSAFGDCNKEYDKAYEGSFALTKSFGLVTFRVIGDKFNVCRRVVTGTREIPEQIMPARSEEIFPAHTEEIVDWDCGSVLAGGEEGE